MHSLRAILLAAMLPFSVAAHTMSPPLQVMYSQGDFTYVKYTVENLFEHPAVFHMELLEKDQKTVFTEWRSRPKEIKLHSGDKKDVYLKIDSSKERKLYVCSRLDRIGYDEQTAYTITRVCGKLWIRNPG